MRKSFRSEKVSALNPNNFLISYNNLNMGKKFFLAVSFVLIFYFLFFYILQINKTIYSSYVLNDLQKNKGLLSQENEQLEKSLAGNGSLRGIEGRVSELGFERVSKIYYIQNIETSVASAK